MHKLSKFFTLSATCSAIVLGSSLASAQDQNDSEKDEDVVVVTATRTEKTVLETPAAISVQDADLLRQKGFTYGTDEFRGVPGVFFRRGEGDGDEFPFLSIRGVTGNHGNDTFLALVDGIPFVGPDEEVLLYEVPYPIVDQIEIVRGPVSALYGRGAIAGAVNYQTRKPGEDRIELSVSAGSDEYYRKQFLFEKSYDNGAGFIASITDLDFEGWRENSARDTTNVFLKGYVPLNEKSTLTGWFNYSDRNAEVPSALPVLEDGTLIDVFGGSKSFLGQKPTRNNVDGWIGALRFDSELSENLSIQVTGQVRSFDSDVRLNFYDSFEFNPAENIMGVNGFASVNESNVFYGEALLNWKDERQNIVAGISTERATLDEEDRWSGEFGGFECNFRFYGILIDYSTGEVINDTPDNACFVREQLRTAADSTNKFYGAFIQDEISLTEELTLTVGARYDSFKRDTDFTVVGTVPGNQSAGGSADAISPKASLAYDFGNSLIYTSYGRGFNSNFGPVWQWEPDRYARDEAPTTIDSFEIGWKGQTPNRMFAWETSVFYIEQKDRRIFVENPDPDGPSQLATTGRKYSSKGLEASIKYRPTENTAITFNYTYLDPEWNEIIIFGSFGSEDVDYSGNKPQGVPENIFYAEVTHDFSSWLTARASYEWYGDYYVTLANNVKGGQYDIMNVSATITPPMYENISLDLSVTNALNDEYFFLLGGSRTSATLATPGVPRQVRATLRAKF